MILRHILLPILFILILLGAALYYIGTESGTQILWNILTKQFPDQISAEIIEGRLGDEVQITNLKINLDQLDITAKEFEFSWQPKKLLQQKIIIDRIKIHGLMVDDRRPPTPPSSDPIMLPEVTLAIKINSFLLTEAEYTSLSLEKPIKINQFSAIVNATGNFDTYQIQIKTTIKQEQVGNVALDFNGNGDRQQFVIEKLQAQLLSGQSKTQDDVAGLIELTGKIGWGEKLAWDLKLAGDNINPGQFQKDWPGKLTLSARLSGQFVDDQLTVSVEDTLINGKLRGYLFKAQTDLKIIDNSLDIKQFNLASGKSVLEASGQVRENLDLKWKLESPDLVELYPETSGQLSAQGTVSGSQTQPVINAILQGNNIEIPGVRFGKLNAQVMLDMVKSKKFDIQLKSSQVIFGEKIIHQLDVLGKGTLSAHTVKADLKSELGNLQFLSQGELKNNRWKGTIQELVLEEKKVGRWQLNKPEKLIASKQHVSLDKLCMNQKQTLLCLEGDWKAGSAWQVNATTDQLQLKQLSPYLPTDLALDGSVSFQLIASGDSNKITSAKLNLKAPAGSIIMTHGKNKPRFEYDTSIIDIIFDKQGAIASLNFNLIQPARSPIRATLKTAPFEPLSVDYKKIPFNGNLTAKIDDLRFIQAFTHELEKIKGSLDVDLSIEGTLEKPEIKGHSKLVAELFLPNAGIQLKNITMDANSQDGQTMVLAGQAVSGEGKIDLQGNIDLIAEGFPTTIEVKGDRFEIVNLPEAWVLASPQLTLSSLNNKLSINGTVTIPEAKLEPQGIASAVPISKDVVIIGSDNSLITKEEQQALEITTKVNVILGDKISLSASGFEGSLKGSLRVTSRPGRPTKGAGRISIYDGQFSAYGQELEIDKGYIVFAGGPIDSPTVDLKAIRKIDEITVGVHATGSVTSPELTLFSKPSMNQDEILSYLLIGHPLSEASGGDGDLLLNAALSLGFKGAEMLTENIVQKLGLDEFSIEGSGKKDAALQIGKYLTPKLYIGFGVGLFESLTQFRLRYDYSKYWTIEAESGTNTSVDILFKIER